MLLLLLLLPYLDRRQLTSSLSPRTQLLTEQSPALDVSLDIFLRPVPLRLVHLALLECSAQQARSASVTTLATGCLLRFPQLLPPLRPLKHFSGGSERWEFELHTLPFERSAVVSVAAVARAGLATE